MLDRILLFPYYWWLKARHNYYSSPKRKLYHTPVPSLCVGNITVGGTGKTPHVEMILRMLLESERYSGANLAVLSRGYKRESKGFQQVTLGGSASMFGDEPLQIKHKFPGVTVAVDKNRVEGCNFLTDPASLRQSRRIGKVWNPEFPAADYIVLDDAYQYRKLKPALSVVLVDYNRPVPSDSLLPFGRLRDLKERLWDADVIIVSKCPDDMGEQECRDFVLNLGMSAYDPVDCSAVAPNGRRQRLFFTGLEYLPVQPAFEQTDPRYAYAKKAILVSGIASDTALRKHLCMTYKIKDRFKFPDHHKYTWSDINRIQLALRKDSTAAIMTTEKDFQRLRDFPGLPAEIKERMFVVPIQARFLTDTQRRLFESIITEL